MLYFGLQEATSEVLEGLGFRDTIRKVKAKRFG